MQYNFKLNRASHDLEYLCLCGNAQEALKINLFLLRIFNTDFYGSVKPQISHGHTCIHISSF